jgi:hypothetical protein
MSKKKIVSLSLGIVIAFAFTFTACKPDKSFDSALLIGKWSQGTEFYRYDRDGKGATWDTADDVTEEEAQTFSWTLEKDLLTLLHDMEMGESKVPKYYTVTVLDDKTLTYKDDFGKSFTFKKN